MTRQPASPGSAAPGWRRRWSCTWQLAVRAAVVIACGFGISSITRTYQLWQWSALPLWCALTALTGVALIALFWAWDRRRLDRLGNLGFWAVGAAGVGIVGGVVMIGGLFWPETFHVPGARRAPNTPDEARKFAVIVWILVAICTAIGLADRKRRRGRLGRK